MAAATGWLECWPTSRNGRAPASSRSAISQARLRWKPCTDVNAQCVFGNWEASGLRGLPAPYRSWVARWPAVLELDGFCVAHASPVWPANLAIGGVVEHLRSRGMHWTHLFPSLQHSESAASCCVRRAAEPRALLYSFTDTRTLQEAWQFAPGEAPRRSEPRFAGKWRVSIIVDASLAGRHGQRGRPARRPRRVLCALRPRNPAAHLAPCVASEQECPDDCRTGPVRARRVTMWRPILPRWSGCSPASAPTCSCCPSWPTPGTLTRRPDELAPHSEPGDGSGPFLRSLTRLAGQTGGLIVAGFAEQGATGLYNSAAAVSGGGHRIRLPQDAPLL